MTPDALFDRYAPMVYRRALRLLGRPADAEEATQEVFIRALKALPSFNPKAQHSTWLYRITTNYCLNRLRDMARRSELLDAHKGDVPRGSLAIDPVKMLTMRRLLADADPQCARAALLVYVDGLTHAEAATLMGVSRRTVGNLCDRFTAWARARLAADAEQPGADQADAE
ncbi:MAG: RNA polymerase sigma-70 factor (ECF subfamily) [Bradymonadia bacterium]